MISFCQPCFRWKLLLASKGHFGIRGFSPPHSTRYLHTLAKHTHQIEDANGVVLENLFGPPQIVSGTLDFDRITGAETSTIPFGFMDPRSLNTGVYTSPQNPALTITDNYLKSVTRVQQGGVFNVNIFEWFLSNEYTFQMLEDDINALIDSVSPDSIDFGRLRTVAHGSPTGLNTPSNTVQLFIANFPADVRYAPGPGTVGENWAIADFNAAAWYLYAPPFFPHEPYHYIKLVGFIQMAGDYCDRTYILNVQQQPVGDPTCVSGQGLCGHVTRIDPPQFVADQHAYKMVIPNCQCQ